MQHIIKNIYITMKTSAGLHYESLFSTGSGWAGGPDENLILLLGHF